MVITKCSRFAVQCQAVADDNSDTTYKHAKCSIAHMKLLLTPRMTCCGDPDQTCCGSLTHERLRPCNCALWEQ